MRSNQHNYQHPTDLNLYNLFERFSFARNSMITHGKLCQILHGQSKKIFNRKLDDSIIEEIWGQAETTSKGEASIETIVEIIMEALHILLRRISDIEGTEESDGMLERKKNQVNEKRRDLEEYESYYGDDANKINKLRRQLVELEFEQNQLENDLEMFTAEYSTLCKIFAQPPTSLANTQTMYKPNPYNSMYIHQSKSQIEFKKSKAFLFIFHLTNVLFILQLLMMTYRLSFLPVIVFLHSYYVIFIGFQSKDSIKLLLAVGAGSIIFDLSYVVMRIIGTIQLMPFIHESNKTFATVCFIFLGISVILRGILLGFYLRYLNSNNLLTRDYIVFFGYEIFLNHENYFQNYQFQFQDRQKLNAQKNQTKVDYQ